MGIVKPVSCKRLLLNNSIYPHELQLLKQYKGFGGRQNVDLKNKQTPRFVHAAYLIKNFIETSKTATSYGFEILESMNRGATQWSYIIDKDGAFSQRIES